MRNNKKTIIAVLVGLMLVMGVGYSILSTTLNITGTVSVNNDFDVVFTDALVQDYMFTEACNDNSCPTECNASTDPSYTDTTASFTVEMEPDTYVTYQFRITNNSDKVALVRLEDDYAGEDLEISYYGIGQGAAKTNIGAGETAILYVVVYVPSTTTTAETETVNITINATQGTGSTTEGTHGLSAIFEFLNMSIEGTGISVTGTTTDQTKDMSLYVSVDGGEYTLAGTFAAANFEIRAVPSVVYDPSSLSVGTHTLKFKWKQTIGTNVEESNEITYTYVKSE